MAIEGCRSGYRGVASGHLVMLAQSNIIFMVAAKWSYVLKCPRAIKLHTDKLV